MYLKWKRTGLVMSVCLSVYPFEKCWMDLDEILCGRYQTFQSPTICNTNMADEEICDVGSTLAPLEINPHNDVWL
jgi:hypothetical protein